MYLENVLIWPVTIYVSSARAVSVLQHRDADHHHRDAELQESDAVLFHSAADHHHDVAVLQESDDFPRRKNQLLWRHYANIV